MRALVVVLVGGVQCAATAVAERRPGRRATLRRRRRSERGRALRLAAQAHLVRLLRRHAPVGQLLRRRAQGGLLLRTPRGPTATSYCTPDSNAEVVYADASCYAEDRPGLSRSELQPPAAEVPARVALRRVRVRARAPVFARRARSRRAQYWTANSDGTCGGPYSGAFDDFYAARRRRSRRQSLVEVTVGAPTGTGQPQRAATAQSADGMQLAATSLHDAHARTSTAIP